MKAITVSSIRSFIVLGLFLSVAMGCAKAPNGTSAMVTISSDTFTTSGAAMLSLHNLVSPSLSRALALPGRYSLNLVTEVQEFKICVKRLKLEDESDQPHTEDGDDDAAQAEEREAEANGELVFTPGLIDVSNGQKKDWGQLNIPVGYNLKSLKVKIAKDKDICGVDYSVSFNGQTSPEDIEFKWKFNPPVALDASTSVLVLSFDSVVTALRAAADSGNLAHMKETIEAIEEDAHEVED